MYTLHARCMLPLLSFAAWMLSVSLLLVPGKGHAQNVTLQTCQMVEHAHYSQPLTNLPANMTVHYDDLGACPNVLGLLLNPEQGVGQDATQAVINTSCADSGANLLPQPVTRYITWSSGKSSQFTANFAPVYAPEALQVTFTGTISQGEFQGATAVMTLTFPGVNFTTCLTGGAGIQDIYGYGTLTLIGVPLL